MPETNDTLQIGTQFIRWGVGLLAFGIFIGFGIIGHYILGANHDTGEMFIKNVTLSGSRFPGRSRCMQFKQDHWE